MSDLETVKIIARKEPWDRKVTLTMGWKRLGEQVNCVALPLQFADQQAGLLVKPFIELEYSTAQELMDQLWECGLRPSSEVGSVGQLKATEAHLADLRTIAINAIQTQSHVVRALVERDMKCATALVTE